MLVSEFVRKEIVPQNRAHCAKWGVPDAKIGDIVEIPIANLGVSSDFKIEVRCDYCGDVFTTSVRVRNRYLRDSIIKKDCCKACRPLKVREGTQVKYGVPSTFMLPEVRHKISVALKEYVSTPKGRAHLETLAAAKRSLSQSVPGPFSNPEVRRKIQDTCIERYGGPSPLCSAEVRKKAKNTCEERYGVKSVIQNPTFMMKMQDTCIERYGVPNAMQNADIKQRALENRCNVVVSKPQQAVFDAVKSLGYTAKLNYRFGPYSYDIAVLDPKYKIDIEYDGYFWHAGRECHDSQRDAFSIQSGWHVIRFKARSGCNDVPTFEQVQNSIKTVLQDNPSVLVVELKG